MLCFLQLRNYYLKLIVIQKVQVKRASSWWKVEFFLNFISQYNNNCKKEIGHFRKRLG